jgi:2-(3-amino-3-carboxypropyl)histidine synthase
MDVKKSQLNKIFIDYTFDIKKFVHWLQKNKIKILAIQLPVGLRLQSLRLVEALHEELNISVILLTDPCFGACDIPMNKMKQLAVDGIAHFGHSEIPSCPKGDIPVKFLELKTRVDPLLLLKKTKHIKELKNVFSPGKKIGLLANIQFIDYLEQMKDYLENKGFNVIIGKGDSRIKHNGQILGCNFSTAQSIANQVSGYLFIGDGRFHPLGVSLSTKKPVLAFNPFNDNLHNIKKFKEKILRQRLGAIAKAKEFKSFGIIVSTKPGQNRMDYAKKIEDKLIRHGYQSTILVMENINPEVLDYLPFNGYINTACPRLTIDDYLLYKKTLLSPIELEIILGVRSWEQYQFDEIIS